MNKVSNIKIENKIFSKRITLALIFILLLTLILISSIFSLQIINYDYYTKESLGNKMRILPIAPMRGKIFDRYGEIIATNQLSYKLTLTIEKIKDISTTLLSLKKFGLINDKDISTFKKINKQYKKFHSIPLKHKLSEGQVAKFLVSNQFKVGGPSGLRKTLFS